MTGSTATQLPLSNLRLPLPTSFFIFIFSKYTTLKPFFTFVSTSVVFFSTFLSQISKASAGFWIDGLFVIQKLCCGCSGFDSNGFKVIRLASSLFFYDGIKKILFFKRDLFSFFFFVKFKWEFFIFIFSCWFLWICKFWIDLKPKFVILNFEVVFVLKGGFWTNYFVVKI